MIHHDFELQNMEYTKRLARGTDYTNTLSSQEGVVTTSKVFLNPRSKSLFKYLTF